MENMQDSSHLAVQATKKHYTAEPIMGNHQLVIISQLLQNIGTMQHIDDLLLWLTHSLAQRLNIDVVQLWTLPSGFASLARLELRTMCCRSQDLPVQVILNSQVVEVIERAFKERANVPTQPVEQVFAHRLASALMQHHLCYWSSYFLSHNVPLPPLGRSAFRTESPPSLVMTASLFTHDQPSSRLLPTIGHILEQAVVIARKHGLLPAGDPSPITALSETGRDDSTMLLDLIPRHARAAGTILFSDARVYHLYQLIDGRKTLAVLFALSQLSREEFYRVLRSLIGQKHIQLYERNGRQVENERMLQLL